VNIIGISAFYHDAAAALVRDGELVAAAQEERFTRKKHDEEFPRNALASILTIGEVEPDGIDAVVYYDKPITTFVRILRTYLRAGPKGFSSFRTAIPIWMREKLWIPYHIEKGLKDLGYKMPKDLWFTEHHESHAASAFYPSPFDSAALLTFDGVGEWATSSIGVGRGNRIELKEQLNFPHSIGLLYSAFTYACGFRVNSGEYKLMGLAPYGEPTYVDRIFDELVELNDDGSFRMDMKYFDYIGGMKMTNRRFDQLFDGPPRQPESEITKREADMARSIQEVTEEIVLRMARHAAEVTGEKDACLAGGVALNCVANGRLAREGPFERLFFQPAAGDAGGAVGAAYYGWFQVADNPRAPDPDAVGGDGLRGAYVGPQFGDDEIHRWLEDSGLPHKRLEPDTRADAIAELLEDGKIIGLFQGRMEFGPRALGNRSIIGDPRDPELQSRMNLKIKFRESFRPFAPSVLAEKASEWFDIDGESPYMMLVAKVADAHLVDAEGGDVGDMRSWVNQVRSEIPAVTHVDGTARLQTVRADTNPGFHAIISAFEARTGVPLVVNTSFNVRGEPIVCTPEDAYRCFMRTEMDYLVLGDCLLDRTDQPEWSEPREWQADLILD
jgi:carbamoyltransferase